MAEWLKAPLSKSGMGETSSRVQIPLSPQRTNEMSEWRRERDCFSNLCEGFEKSEYIARSVASTIRRLYRSCKDQIPLSPQNTNLYIQQNLPKIFQSLVNLNNSCLHERGIDQFSLTFKLVKINN